MNNKYGCRMDFTAKIVRCVILLAACLMLLGPVPGTNGRLYADDAIEEYFNLPLTDIWTSGATTSRTNIHFYKFTLKEAGMLTVNIENMKSGQIFFLADEEKNHVGGNNGQIISGSSGGIWGATESTPYAGSRSFYLEKGIYYVKIKPWDDGEYFGKYKVKATFTPAENVETEPNQDSTQAMPISLGKEYRGLLSEQDKKDWYRFTLEGTDPVGILFRVHCSGIDWQIHDSALVGKTGGTEYGGSVTTPKTRYFKKVLAPGSYFLRVEPNDALGKYDFMLFYPVTAITLTCPDTFQVGEEQKISAEITPSAASFPDLVWTSSDTSVAEVSGKGVVTPKKAGTTTITAAANDGLNASESVTIKVVAPAPKTAQKISGPKSSYTLTVGGDAFRLNAKTSGDGKLTYKSSNKKVVTVTAVGRVTPVGIGTAKITITAAGTKKYAKKTKAVTITVNPKSVKFKTVVNVSGKKVKLTWKKAAGIDGYEIEYSTNAKFKSGTKSVDIASPGTVTRTLSGLKKGKTYYVRIRAYKDASDGKTYISAWTKKSVKVTK